MESKMKNDIMIDSDWISDNLNNPAIRLVEVSDMKNANAYFEWHIPGAVLWPWMESLWHPTSRAIIPPDGFSALMEKSGITHDMTIVLYSNQFQYACYACRVCMMRGHSRVKILDGQRDVWLRQNRPVSHDLPSIDPSSYPVRPPDDSSSIRFDEVLKGLEKADRVVVDLRTTEEYLGERVSPPWFEYDHGAVRSGHIPGARNLFYAALLNDDESLKPLESIREAFVDVGATPDKEIITYCRLSHRGSMGWFILKYLLGYPRVKVYDGSWTEWGSLYGVPIENQSLKQQNQTQL